MIQLLLRWSVLALGVTLATKLVPGIECNELSTLIIVVVLLSFLNAVLKPVLMLFALPFIVVTMGLGIILINAVLFWLVGEVVDGFTVQSFGSALIGAVIVSVTNMLLGGMLGSAKAKDEQRKGGGRGGRGGGGGSGRSRRDDDVIDI
ncbi:phage holin family protein [Actomonas aquatica]|uniref:Phage holin family protein n=1 Tax=Actomonas aquatica TaxID=2866162 RepID=A0ABZ1CAH8_9BACT|nr:phage holin family protein [Opitutus sp. WL0086]WRQ88645.1 phage holin family protein [Opitutus sp. WL0086]